MKASDVNIGYYAYVEKFTRDGFEPYNVFSHWRFLEDTQENLKKNKDDKAAFEERLKLDAMYYFWSKCEWEIIVSAWPPNENVPEEKIDVYDQLKMNWNIFVDYVWNHRKEICRIKYD